MVEFGNRELGRECSVFITWEWIGGKGWGRETGVVKVGFSTVWKSLSVSNRGNLAKLWKSGKKMEKTAK